MSYKNQNGIKSICSVMYSDSSSSMADICKHAEFLYAVNKKLKELLPLPIRDHCILANIGEYSATFHTQSSAWATRLRFSTPELLDILHRQLNLTQIKSVRIKVSLPEGEFRYAKRRPKLALTRKASRLLKSYAESISYAELRTALEKLSQNADV